MKFTNPYTGLEFSLENYDKIVNKFYKLKLMNFESLSFKELTFIEFNYNVPLDYGMDLYILSNKIREFNSIKSNKYVHRHQIVTISEPRTVYIFTQTNEDYKNIRKSILQSMKNTISSGTKEPQETEYENGKNYVHYKYYEYAEELKRKSLEIGEGETLKRERKKQKDYFWGIIDDIKWETLNVYILNNNIRKFGNIKLKESEVEKMKNNKIVTFCTPREVFIFTKTNVDYILAKDKFFELLNFKYPKSIEKENEETHKEDSEGNKVSFVHYQIKSNFPGY